MRRSKSNPAKYARNYRKISQRHMTGYGDNSGSSSNSTKDNNETRLEAEEKERKRLETILLQSEQTWKRGLAEKKNGHNDNDEKKKMSLTNNNNDSKTENLIANTKQQHDDDECYGGDVNVSDNDNNNNNNNMLSLLSPELREQFSGMSDNTLLILPSKKKKKTNTSNSTQTKALPPLTPQEIKAAKAMYKNTQRKLQQLEHRKQQKELRSGLYKQLEEHTLLQQPKPQHHEATNVDDGHTTTGGTNNNKNAFANNTTRLPIAISSQQAQSLLLKSSELGKKLTKKERLKQLRRKEALGIPLTQEEMDLLVVKYDAPSLDTFPSLEVSNKGNVTSIGDANNENGSGAKKRRNNEMKRKRAGGNYDNDQQDEDIKDGSVGAGISLGVGVADGQTRACISLGVGVADEQTRSVSTTTDEKKNDGPTPSIENAADKSSSSDHSNVPTQNFSQMMFASLTSLKTKTDTRNQELATEMANKQAEEEDRIAKLEAEERKHRKVYVPVEIPMVSTMHLIGKDASPNGGTEKRTAATHVHRPASIEASRYDLPVSAMEYEIIDAIRSNDCTILCSETGSGKSTQVPQFLYEAGFSTSDWWKKQQQQEQNRDSSEYEGRESNPLMIGITQPRRVAAVSTAKRVCYEMGCGNGQSVSNNNLVAYQTRYETAGLGPSTRVKFMTDGILLQEIQSDLLLRKYGAIVIDEAHERNLNTDVLLGLLSLALPLRRRAAEEGSLPPLKLVVMSATLRVEDFTNNTRLFPVGDDGEQHKPALVTVTGRTHPVSIHHSKVTELDNYEKAAIDKVCKIHRKLPPGGILVFLTGKQEIIRCVNRLKQKLGYHNEKKISTSEINESPCEWTDVHQSNGDVDGFRDMDDEEVDGDLFQQEEDDDDIDNLNSDEAVDINLSNDDNDKRPRKVQILPLYSMLSADEQAKVFAPVPDDTRLIVIATNIAETSITIPGITYVVDSGRQKCRNYHAGTGVASYDVMWISKAAADQRAGRAGRTGPGHCYRLYSSSVYSRYLDEYAIPEVLTRPLEDIVLAMKAMHVSNVTSFPFPTAPEQSQINAAVRLLANLGCVDISRVEEQGGDGKITPLGAAVAKLPLGVRYGKMLLVAAQANVLDYAIVLVSALSEATPFVHHMEHFDEDDASKSKMEDEVDQTKQTERDRKREIKSKWMHDGGDILAAIKAVGAYAYAGRGAGGSSEKLACRKFCEENGLHFIVMQRIAKMRFHLCKLAKTRLPHAGGVAAETGKYLPSMSPPKRIQECLLRQAIAAGLLDNIARRAPPGLLPAEFSGIPRSAYICGNASLKEPLFIDNNSMMHSKRPEWVCFDSIVRKTKNDGTTIATMQKVTPIDAEWMAGVCHGSNLMTIGSALANPAPRYVKEKDSIQCPVETKFGGHGWDIPPCYVDMYDLLENESKTDQRKQSSAFIKGDSFRWFARYLLEGKVLPELSSLLPMLNDEPAIITRRKPMKKVVLIVSTLSEAGVDSAAALRKHWSEKDDKFLFKAIKPWVTPDSAEEAKRIWIGAVTTNIKLWRDKGKELGL